MSNETFTFTARSQKNPEKMVTYTLNNGDVTMQLGNVMLEQLEKASENYEAETGVNVGDWAKPAAVGVAQRMMQPLPVDDFNAAADGETFRTITWLRAGGLRLAPIIMKWDAVDNPEGAQAFVDELKTRQEESVAPGSMPAVFDYWASWMIAVATLIISIFMLRRLWQQKKGEQ